jgi:hypothetical protein
MTLSPAGPRTAWPCLKVWLRSSLRLDLLWRLLLRLRGRLWHGRLPLSEQV